MIGLLMKTFNRARPRPVKNHKLQVIIVAGFLGAGKTTFITKLLKEINDPEHTLIIENDFGAISFDSIRLQEDGLQVNSLVSGCICCNLIEDFEAELRKAIHNESISYLIIEPSGVSKLSDIVDLCQKPDVKSHINMISICTIVDASNTMTYAKNFGEFFEDQIRHGQQIFMSHTENHTELTNTLKTIQKFNIIAPIYLLNWDDVSLFHYIKQHPREEISRIVDEHRSHLDDIHHIMDYEENEHSPLHQYEHNKLIDAYHHQTTHHDHPIHEKNCIHEHKESSHNHHSDIPFNSFLLEYTDVLSVDEWRHILDECLHRDVDNKIIRIKGVLPTTEGPYEVQYNNHSLTLIRSTLNALPLTIIGNFESTSEFHQIFNHHGFSPLEVLHKEYS